MPPFLVVGLMSGTSQDGVTAVLTQIAPQSLRVLKQATYPYAPALKQQLLKAPRLKALELSRLNYELGLAFAQAAINISKGRKPQLIGSHGQTICHEPDGTPPSTLQLGEAAIIAEKTGITTAADFRPGDIAAGGQGAPLIAAFDEFLFSSGPLRALQNIGGIANVSFVGEGRLWSAFDTGPGNCLLDLAVRLATGGRAAMDKDGNWAAQGRPDFKKLQALLRHPYFKQKPPKSLDKEFFGHDFLRKNFSPLTLKRLPDILATLVLLTSHSIAESYKRFVPKNQKISEVVLSGGGALNPVLKHQLSELLQPLPLVLSDQYGIPAMAKEAAAFAWLGYQTWHQKPNNCPQATGARGRKILGKLSYA